jgi:uncharacterized protein YecT (DUF1311 family)
MHAIWSTLVAIQLGLAHPACAEESAAPDHSISQKLPLFAQNHCERHQDPANQLFCADPELGAAGEKLSNATQERLSRIPDRLMAVEENAQWVRDRNSSCGILASEPVRFDDIDAVKACLLRETEERTAILLDPNFDCLAANNAAGALICGDPSLQIAESELNAHVLALIAKLGEDQAKEAFAEYARWTRDRDRKCNLAGKDNVPLQELSPSESCLAEFMSGKAAEIAAAKGDPRRIFGRRLASPLPNADAVDLCVAQIHIANSCGDFLRTIRVFEIDSQVTEQNALVTAGVEMIVLSPFAVCSPVASNCTGTCWDLKAGNAQAQSAPASRDSFPVSHRIRIEKAFAFQKTDGGWRCNASALRPVNLGVALGAR